MRVSRFGGGERVSALLTLVRGFVGDGLKAISAVEGVEQIVVSRTALDRDTM